MRGLLTILFFWAFAAQATNYYVSNAGSDANNGTSSATPWATLAKVSASTFSSGDSILLKCGDTWNEKLRLSNNGIIVSSYGTGLKPILTGFQSLAMSSAGTNLWQGTALQFGGTGTTNGVNTYAKLNTVLVNGLMVAKGRYPNSSNLSGWIDNLNQIRIGGSSIPASYVGGELVTNSRAWVWDVSKIIRQSGTAVNDTFTVQEPVSYNGAGFFVPYFIQNHPSVLDQQGEWCFDSAAKLLTVYSTSNPSVQYSSLDTLVYLNGADNITFSNLKFTGANMIALCFDGSDNFKALNCTFENNGFNALQGSPSHYAIIQQDSIVNTWNDAMRIFGDSVKILSNYLYNTGTKAGMGGSGNGMYIGFYGGMPSKDSLKVVGNTFKNTGYNAIHFEGTKSLIYRNLIDSFCTVKDDGGAIYCYDDYHRNSIVRSNLISNGIGQTWYAAGVYMDGVSKSVTIDSNTIQNANKYAIWANSSGHQIKSNTVVNAIGVSLGVGGSTGTSVTDNIFYQTLRGTMVINSGFTSGTGLTWDRNRVLRVGGSDSLYWYGQPKIYYSLAGWRTLTGLDMSGTDQFPTGITSTTPTLYNNPTQSDSTISFAGWKVDAKGTVCPGSVTIRPFGSALLFSIATPAIQYINKKYFRFKKVTR